MGGPIRNEVVLVCDGSEFEVTISVADGATPIGRVVESIIGWPPNHVLVDGYPVPVDRPVSAAGVSRGSRLEAVADAPPTPVCCLVGLGGSGAAAVRALGPGAHVIVAEPRPGSVDVGVQVRSDEGGAACLYVDVDGAARIDPACRDVRIAGEPTSSISPVAPGDEIRIDGRAFCFTDWVATPERSGPIAFNRPPRSEFPASLPLLVAPAAPPEAQKPLRFGWGALVIPLLVGGLMAVLWNPMMAIFAVFSPVMTLANWYEDKRRARRERRAAAAEVSVAMGDFEQRFGVLYDAARVLAFRASPGPAELITRVVGSDSRLWQRRHDHPDFMELGLGVGTLPWTPEITPAEADRAAAANDLIARSRRLEAVPVTVDFGEGRVLGIAGHRRRQIEQTRWLVVQAASHHGPADLGIYVITDRVEDWDCLKWLPHLQLGGDSSRLAVAAPGPAADELLAPLLDWGENDPAAALRPKPAGSAVLLVVDIGDVTAPSAASVRRALSGEGARRRCGVALAETVEELPSSCTDILRLDTSGHGFLDCPSRGSRIGPLQTWRLAASGARRMARLIGRYVDPDVPAGAANLADVVHLFDLLGLDERSPDAILRRWRAAGPKPRCAAPIGVTAEGPLIVDWVADGPHGLLAGTTGAGKSELLRSLVASLAATMDPEHLNFVLIDYKGGSAFDACAGLPHTVGMVTDLDGHLARRALTCLEAELRYREEALRSVGADNIDGSQTVGRGEPLPRLLVVIDEFAALAKELPDFMAALVDIAQRGRSLGVHLLLATQRPNGVINDSIRANTNLRLSLRVQDIADSMDVIGTTDAAVLSRTRPGRGYLRRGPGDVVAFQSALVTGMSGGSASAVAVAPFELTGDSTLQSAGSPGGLPRPRSDLEDLVAMIGEAAAKAEMRPARLPWPEPLPAEVSLDRLALDFEDREVAAGEVVIGMVDQPSRQRRRPFSWNPDGNLFIYGVQGSGTTNGVIAAVAAACRHYSSTDLHVYALDFDDQRLSALEPLPHVGAVIGAGERDRQIRLLRYLQQEVAARREALATDPTSLIERSRIIVAVDNYGGFRAAFDDPADIAVKESLGRLVADGPGVGVVVVASAKQPIDIPSTVAALVTSKLVMRLADRYEYTGLGVSLSDLPATPGRAFEAGTSLEVQLAVVSPPEIVDWAGHVGKPDAAHSPWAIELLPSEVKIPDISGVAEVYDLEWRVPVAIGDDRLEPVGWTLREGEHVLITGPARSGKSTALATIASVLRTARPTIRIVAVTPRRSPLAEFAAVDLLVVDLEHLPDALSGLDPGVAHALLVDDAEDIDDSSGILAQVLADRLPRRHIFAAGTAEALRSAYGHWTQVVRRSRLGLALKPNVSSDGDLWNTTLPRHGPAIFPTGRGYLVADGGVELAQVAWQ